MSGKKPVSPVDHATIQVGDEDWIVYNPKVHPISNKTGEKVVYNPDLNAMKHVIKEYKNNPTQFVDKILAAIALYLWLLEDICRAKGHDFEKFRKGIGPLQLPRAERIRGGNIGHAGVLIIAYQSGTRPAAVKSWRLVRVITREGQLTLSGQKQALNVISPTSAKTGFSARICKDLLPYISIAELDSRDPPIEWKPVQRSIVPEAVLRPHLVDRSDVVQYFPGPQLRLTGKKIKGDPGFSKAFLESLPAGLKPEADQELLSNVDAEDRETMDDSEGDELTAWMKRTSGTSESLHSLGKLGKRKRKRSNAGTNVRTPNMDVLDSSVQSEDTNNNEGTPVEFGETLSHQISRSLGGGGALKPEVILAKLFELRAEVLKLLRSEVTGNRLYDRLYDLRETCWLDIDKIREETASDLAKLMCGSIVAAAGADERSSAFEAIEHLYDFFSNVDEVVDLFRDHGADGYREMCIRELVGDTPREIALVDMGLVTAVEMLARWMSPG